MRIGGQNAKVFKIKNRRGYAAVCGRHLTEGATTHQASDRMVKALRRTGRKRRQAAAP